MYIASQLTHQLYSSYSYGRFTTYAALYVYISSQLTHCLYNQLYSQLWKIYNSQPCRLSLPDDIKHGYCCSLYEYHLLVNLYHAQLHCIAQNKVIVSITMDCSIMDFITNLSTKQLYIQALQKVIFDCIHVHQFCHAAASEHNLNYVVLLMLTIGNNSVLV